MSDEGMLEAEDEEFDPQEVLERLAELRRNPLDPNRASFSQLQQIPYFSVFQIKGILDQRNNIKFKKLEDLLEIQGMDQGTLARVRPFLRVRPTQQRWGRFRSRMSLTLPPAKGYRQGLYGGNPLKVYLRLDLLASEHLRLGAFSEKDAGEKDLADYRSFYLQLEGIGPLRRVVVGSFALEFGQGLVLWTGTGSSGGALSLSAIKLTGSGVRPYTSTDENLGLRGIAAASVLGPLEFSLFFSGTQLDASLEGDGARNFYQSGLHRNEREMEKKDVLGELLAGGHLSGRLARDKVVGLTWYRSRYRPGLIVPDLTRQRYAFRGENSQVFGSHFDMVFGPLNFFGEGAVNQRGAHGAILGLLLDSGAVRTSLVWRRYQPDFCNPHGSGLAEKEDQNEFGILLGLAWRLVAGTQFELLVDQHRRPWRSYLLEMPSAGERWSVQLTRKLGSRATLTLRHRERHGEVTVVSSLGTSKNARRDQRSRRLQLDWRAAKGLELRGRLETNRVSFETQDCRERGALLLAQMRLSPSQVFSLRGTVTCFRAPSYDGRMYVCEVGPVGVARNVALFGRGIRAFLLVRWRMIKGLELSAKFCSTHFDDRQSIGDGSDQIEGDVKKEVLVQLDWRW